MKRIRMRRMAEKLRALVSFWTVVTHSPWLRRLVPHGDPMSAPHAR